MADIENGNDPIEAGAERISRDAAEIKASRERELGIDAQIAELGRQKLHEKEVRLTAEKDIAEVDADLEGRDSGGPTPVPAPGPVMPPQPPRPRVG